MRIRVNGSEKEIQEETSVDELLTLLEIKEKVMAIAVNMQIVKKEEWKNHTLREGDSLEALEFVGGG